MIEETLQAARNRKRELPAFLQKQVRNQHRTAVVCVLSVIFFCLLVGGSCLVRGDKVTLFNELYFLFNDGASTTATITDVRKNPRCTRHFQKGVRRDCYNVTVRAIINENPIEETFEIEDYPDNRSILDKIKEMKITYKADEPTIMAMADMHSVQFKRFFISLFLLPFALFILKPLKTGKHLKQCWLEGVPTTAHFVKSATIGNRNMPHVRAEYAYQTCQGEQHIMPVLRYTRNDLLIVGNPGLTLPKIAAQTLNLMSGEEELVVLYLPSEPKIAMYFNEKLFASRVD